MEKLKFRAYVVGDARFIYCHDNDENYLGKFFTAIHQIEKRSGQRVPVDQWTGLIDKYGKEIYARDILRFNTLRMMVEWDKQKAAYYLSEVDGPFRQYLTQSKARQYEVIGNSLEIVGLLER